MDLYFVVAGVGILPLVLGLVEFAKKLGLKGELCTVLAVFLGFLFSGLAYAMQSGLIAESAIPWISLVIVALAGGLGAAGLYDLGKKWSGNGD